MITVDTWISAVQTRSDSYGRSEFSDASGHRERIRSLIIVGGVIAALTAIVCLVAFAGDPPPQNTFLDATAFP